MTKKVVLKLCFLPIRDFNLYDEPGSRKIIEKIKAGDEITILAFKTRDGLEKASEDKA
ncbi:MAG: hypothetical protein N3B16_08420 [Candidatus Aminicenantes bacterium]|nr:hypothetical protein [Candidatus Aminicenantes bacterium]